MTRRCAWCEAAVSAKRRGRKGARSFCGGQHKRAFDAAARAIGTAWLDNRSGAAEKALEQWRANSSA